MTAVPTEVTNWTASIPTLILTTASESGWAVAYDGQGIAHHRVIVLAHDRDELVLKFHHNGLIATATRTVYEDTDVAQVYANGHVPNAKVVAQSVKDDNQLPPGNLVGRVLGMIAGYLG